MLLNHESATNSWKAGPEGLFVCMPGLSRFHDLGTGKVEAQVAQCLSETMGLWVSRQDMSISHNIKNCKPWDSTVNSTSPPWGSPFSSVGSSDLEQLETQLLKVQSFFKKSPLLTTYWTLNLWPTFVRYSTSTAMGASFWKLTLRIANGPVLDQFMWERDFAGPHTSVSDASERSGDLRSRLALVSGDVWQIIWAYCGSSIVTINRNDVVLFHLEPVVPHAPCGQGSRQLRRKPVNAAESWVLRKRSLWFPLQTSSRQDPTPESRWRSWRPHAGISLDSWHKLAKSPEFERLSPKGIPPASMTH